MSGDPNVVAWFRNKIATLRTGEGSAFASSVKAVLRLRGLPDTADGLQEYLANYQREAALEEQEQAAEAARQRQEASEQRSRDAEDRRRQEEWELIRQQKQLELEQMRLENDRLRYPSVPTSSDDIGEDVGSFDEFDNEDL